MSQIGSANVTDLATLAERHEAFFIDQFGVLHDGQSAYPGAIDALRSLKAAGKRIVLLSNSGKRSAPNVERLQALGFDRSDYDSFLTSGEVAWSMLSSGSLARAIPSGARCLLISRDDGASAIDGLGLHPVADGRDADVLIISGSRGDEVDLDHYRALICEAAARGIPCLCTNPDKLMLTGAGIRFGAGTIAELYQRLGGPVTWIGKPHPEIYRVALKHVGNPDPARVCCIGDSPEHDIAGGAAIGAATAYVQSGIHSGADEQDLVRLFARFSVAPDYILPNMRWRG